jgi:cardiolipin synthase
MPREPQVSRLHSVAGVVRHHRRVPPPDPVAADRARSDVWTVPNALSVLRLLLVPVFLVLLINDHDLLAVVVLAVSGATDYLDGKLARAWNQQSRIGELLDPSADRLYIIATLIAFVVRDIIPLWLAVVLVGRDVVLGLALPVLKSVGHGPLPVHFLGKAATFCLLYAFPLLLLGDRDDGLGTVGRIFGWAFVWWGTGLYLFAGALYLGQVAAVVRAARTR